MCPGGRPGRRRGSTGSPVGNGRVSEGHKNGRYQYGLQVGADLRRGEVVGPRGGVGDPRRPGHSLGEPLWDRSSRCTPPTRGWLGVTARNQLSTTGKRASLVKAGMKKAACHGRSSPGHSGVSQSSRGRSGKILASIHTPPYLHNKERRRISEKASRPGSVSPSVEPPCPLDMVACNTASLSSTYRPRVLGVTTVRAHPRNTCIRVQRRRHDCTHRGHVVGSSLFQ